MLRVHVVCVHLRVSTGTQDHLGSITAAQVTRFYSSYTSIATNQWSQSPVHTRVCSTHTHAQTAVKPLSKET